MTHIKSKDTEVFLIVLIVVLTLSSATYALGYEPGGIAGPPWPGVYPGNGEAGDLTGGDGQEDIAAEDEAKEDNDTEQAEEKRRRLEAERLAREEALQEELGDLFVPLPPLEQEPNPKVKARALYLTGHSVGLTSRYEKILKMVDETELNALVIDVKDDHGRITYGSDIEFVNEIGSEYGPPPIRDLKETINDLHEKGIYTIARLVIYKDPYLAEKRHDLAIQRSDGGGVWRDNRGVAWVNPYQREVWDYNVAVAKEVALAGFREIQYDYIRFPENAKHIENHVYYPGHNDIEKDEIIRDFIEYARAELTEYNVHIGADVFGVIATSWGDSDQIGQTWEKISPIIEYICPMIYPSHYGPGYFGYSVPDANPEGTIRKALEDSIKRNAGLENPAAIRPWLQSFTATWIRGHIPYGAREVRQQIDVARELGIEEYMLWNAGNVYPAGALYTAAEADRRIAESRRNREEQGLDSLGRAPGDAVEIYLEAIRKKDWREAYPIHGPGFPFDPGKYRELLDNRKLRPVEWEIISVEHQEHQEHQDNQDNQDIAEIAETSAPELQDNTETAETNGTGAVTGGEGVAKLTVILKAGEDELTLENEKWDVIMVNDVWKVFPSREFLQAAKINL